MQNALFILGLAALGVAWLGPLPRMAEGAFAAHMTMHMTVVAIASPMIALGLAGGKFDPVRRFPGFFLPIPASVVELVFVWAWHAPELHHAARHSTAGFVAEQGSFLFSGLLVWLSVFGGDARIAGERGNRGGAGVAALLMTSMHMTLLGALLALTPRPLYAYHGVSESVNALADQQLGGAIMILVGGIVYLAGGLGLTAVLLRGRPVKTEARA